MTKKNKAPKNGDNQKAPVNPNDTTVILKKEVTTEVVEPTPEPASEKEFNDAITEGHALLPSVEIVAATPEPTPVSQVKGFMTLGGSMRVDN